MTSKTFTQYGTAVNIHSINGTQSYQYISAYKNAFGANTPGFRSTKKKSLPVNSYSMEGYRAQLSRFYTSDTNFDYPDGPSTTVTGSSAYWFIPFKYDDAFLEAASNSVTSRILNEIKSMDINLAQSFGERLQTASLLANTASRLTRSYSHLRHGRLSSALGVLGSSTFELDKRHPGASRRYKTAYPKNPRSAASSAWLEMQYGWRPLLNDVYGGAKALADFHHERESDVFNGSYSKKASVTLRQERPITNYFQKDTIGVKLTINYTLSNPLLRYSAMMGLTNPALLAWELTPFSFVVDWFLPIGKFLSNIDAAYGLSFVNGSKSVRYSSVSGGYYYHELKDPYRVYFETCQMGASEFFSLDRYPLTEFPAAPLPSFKSPVSVNNAISAIALLIQVFKR